MKTTARFAHSRTARRGGFTLIELMVVIAIMAALMALTASAAIKLIEVQQNNNTQSTLARTQGELNKAWSKVKDQAYRETIPSATSTWIQTYLAGSDPNAIGRTRVIYVKLRLRQAFPMNFNEVFNIGVPAGYPLLPLPVYTTYLSNLGITASTGANYESSACLLMALERGVSGAGVDPSSLTKGGATGSAATPLPLPSGGSIPYLTDAWSRPIYFSRFPTGSTVLNPNGAQPGANDPGDPQGYLNSPAWQQLMPQGQQLFLSLAQQNLAPLSSPPYSYKLAPMVASGGPVNWLKTGTTPPFDPIAFTPTTTSSGAMFSNP